MVLDASNRICTLVSGPIQVEALTIDPSSVHMRFYLPDFPMKTADHINKRLDIATKFTRSKIKLPTLFDVEFKALSIYSNSIRRNFVHYL